MLQQALQHISSSSSAKFPVFPTFFEQYLDEEEDEYEEEDQSIV